MDNSCIGGHLAVIDSPEPMWNPVPWEISVRLNMSRLANNILNNMNNTKKQIA